MESTSPNIIPVIRKRGSRTYAQKKKSADTTQKLNEEAQQIKDEIQTRVIELANKYGV